jgi:P-type Ca2+ transporter type 2C
MQTELGRIATLLQEATDTQTPMQRRLKRFASQLAIVVIVLCVVIFGIGLLRGEPPLLMFLTALSLAVAAMPEALPAVITVSLALGARRMVARRALVRRLPAVETLGSVTYICSDKTGTLTQNRMQVAEVRPPTSVGDGTPPDASAPAGTARELLLRVLALNSDATITAHGTVEGEPTEVALLEYARGKGVDLTQVQRDFPRVSELPFSSERGRMTTRHARAAAGDALLTMKGSPERVGPCCTHALHGEQRLAFDEEAAHRQAREMAAAGLRVLAVAMREWGDPPDEALTEADESGMTWLGLVGLLDPLRPEATAAVQECESAGIVVVMITGDHPATATAIAQQLGIATTQTPGALAGDALARMDEDDLRAQVNRLRVYARVAPEQKIRIVRALQGGGEFVAMTGDGVNDAPALQQADIGIAMGKAGTDVAREAADMVLVDDNFASIVAAVREGRRIYDNIRKFIKYTLTSNSGEIWVLLLAPFLGLPVPLLPIHILWINLVTDGLPGLALAIEPEERGVMRRPPRPPRESIFAHGLWQHTLWVGLLMGVVSLFTQGWAIASDSAHWQSMTFTVLSLSQLGHALAVRSERDSLFTQGLWSNRALTLAVAGTVVLQMATLYVPAMNAIFKTEPLSAGELLFCLGMSCVTFCAVEAEKFSVRRGWLYGEPAEPQTGFRR